jgi:hypothetical protein
MKEYERRSRLTQEKLKKQKNEKEETNDFIEHLQQLKKQRDENPYRKQEVLVILSSYSLPDVVDLCFFVCCLWPLASFFPLVFVLCLLLFCFYLFDFFCLLLFLFRVTSSFCFLFYSR